MYYFVYKSYVGNTEYLTALIIFPVKRLTDRTLPEFSELSFTGCNI